MRVNSISGAPRGTNVFNDLLEASHGMAAALRMTGNKPLDMLGHATLAGAVDDVLDAIGPVYRAAPRVGHAFDLDAGPDVINADRPVWSVEANADEEMLDDLEQLGYFDLFADEDRARVRDALEKLDRAQFEVHRIGPGGLCPVGLFDLVARVVLLAVTGSTTTTWSRWENERQHVGGDEL